MVYRGKPTSDYAVWTEVPWNFLETSSGAETTLGAPGLLQHWLDHPGLGFLTGKLAAGV